MAKLSVDDILDAIKELSIIEAAELSKKIEEEFGIQAAAPMAAGVAAPGGGGAAAAEEVEEQTEFDVVLQAAGDKKIQVIKEVRALTSLGLKEAKDLVDGAPKPVLERVPKEQGELESMTERIVTRVAPQVVELEVRNAETEAMREAVESLRTEVDAEREILVGWRREMDAAVTSLQSDIDLARRAIDEMPERI